MNKRIQKHEAAFIRSCTLCGTVCCICICAAVCYIAFLLVGRSESPRRLWSPVVIQPNGSAAILGDTRQMEFWTPSAQTKDYLPKAGGEIAASDRWQVIANDDTVIQFGTMLHSNKNVLGYRRVDVWGHGRTTMKPGWWWTLNVLTNYSEADLGRSYEDFWKSHQAVFIEVIDNRGRSD
jgi:hypothetical protein